jgi:AcrR family transcriptional regulator
VTANKGAAVEAESSEADASTGVGSSTALPPSPRGRRTRQKLIDAAVVVFERDGFLNARIADISEEAGVAHGSFYTYFPSKEEVLRQAALELQEQMLAETRVGLSKLAPKASYRERVRASNSLFLLSYQRHAAMIATIDQVATFNDETREIRREARRDFVERTRRGIETLIAKGLAAPDLDPMYLANALGSMVERAAYIWFCVGEPCDFDEAVDTLTEVWVRAVRLADEAG